MKKFLLNKLSFASVLLLLSAAVFPIIDSAFAAITFDKAVKNFDIGDTTTPLTNPVSIAVGDFDNDGNLDLAMVNGLPVKVLDQYKFYLSILFGTGDSTLFGDPTTPTIIELASCPTNKKLTNCSQPVFVAAGKFDADAYTDLAVVYFGVPRPSGGDPVVPGKVSIFLSNGISRTFAAPTDDTVGNGAVSAAVADIDDDGKLDLAVANREDDTVAVLWGDGSGGFVEEPDSRIAVGKNPVSIAIADFNNPYDGKLDLAVANLNANTVSIRLYDTGNPRHFITPTTCDGTNADCLVGIEPIGIVTGDLNGDGKADLAVASQLSKTLTVLLGQDGAGLFDILKGTTKGKTPAGLAAGDFHGDGALDLVTAQFPGHAVSVFPGNDNGTFGPASLLKSTGGGAGNFAVAVGDFNADGQTDIAVANGKISVFLNTTPPPPGGAGFDVTSPDGGETLTNATTAKITWTFSGFTSSDSVRIDLSTNGGTDWKTIIKSTPNIGSVLWKVKSTATTQGRIRICSVNYPGICDQSAGNFTIN